MQTNKKILRACATIAILICIATDSANAITWTQKIRRTARELQH